MDQTVFVIQHKNTNAQNITLRKLGEYIARSVNNAGEFIKALDPEDLEFEELDEPTDPPDDVNVIRIEKWKTSHKNWNTKKLQREEANKAACAIILAQCSEGVRDKMKTHTEWNQPVTYEYSVHRIKVKIQIH